MRGLPARKWEHGVTNISKIVGPRKTVSDVGKTVLCCLSPAPRR